MILFGSGYLIQINDLNRICEILFLDEFPFYSIVRWSSEAGLL